MSGGSGADWFSYTRSNSAVQISLTSGTGSSGDAAGDTFDGFERVLGSDYGDVITGDAGGNIIWARGGADILQGLAGNDILRGGAGADHLNGGSGQDWADYRGSSQGVVVNLASGSTSGGDAAGDVLISIERLRGSDHADHLTAHGAGSVIFGNGGADVLLGQSGNDVLRGGAGGDTLIGGAGVDRLDYTGSAAGVFADLQSGVTFGGDADHDVISGLEQVVGSRFADRLWGDGQNNFLSGGRGG